jgi:hypothetical protein
MSDVHHLTAVSLEVSSGRERLERGLRLLLEDVDRPRAKRRKRKPMLSAALKQADQAGKAVRSATVAPDGTVSIAFGEPEPTETSNPWLDDLKVTKR